MQYCQACGFGNVVGAAVCAHCGAPAGAAPMVLQGGYYPPQRQRSGVMPALLITGGVIAFLAVVVFGILVVIGMRVEAREKAEATARKQAQIASIQQVKQQEGSLNAALKSDIEASKPTTDADFNRIARRIDAYVADARQVDISGCPSDYAEAYNSYLAAWSDEAASVREHPHIPTEGEAFVNGFLAGVNGDPTGGAQQLQDQFQTWINDLKAKDAEIKKRADTLNSIATQDGA